MRHTCIQCGARYNCGNPEDGCTCHLPRGLRRCPACLAQVMEVDQGRIEIDGNLPPGAVLRRIQEAAARLNRRQQAAPPPEERCQCNGCQRAWNAGLL